VFKRKGKCSLTGKGLTSHKVSQLSMLLYLELEACISSDASLNCTEAMGYSLITLQGIQYNVKQTSRRTGICMHVGA